MQGMTRQTKEDPTVVSETCEIAASAERIFELIADPAQQPRWDGNDTLAEAATGQRIRSAGDLFIMTLTGGSARENHVVEFEEGLRVAWKPAEPGQEGTCGAGNSSRSSRRERASHTPTTGPI
jgi:uncharacterized protein YndB with AHSA1/START domain